MTPRKKAEWIGYYRTMLLIRYFESRVEDLFTRGLVKGTTHPSIGQEAVAVGACATLGKNDYITSTHRGHGHFLARGGDPRRMMAELYGKATGYSRGRGGSQLMADFSMGFLGSNGITGGGISLATGVALSLKLRHKPGMVLCFFGDGAASQGTFHESLNMASLWKLPVVFLCENNMYAMSSHVRETVSIEHIAERADGYGMPGTTIDGNDFAAVRDAVAGARRRALAGEGPSLLECKTYRLSGHSRGDPRIYRTREEETTWWEKDPITRFRETLKADGMLTPREEAAIRKQIRGIVSDCVAFARRSPDPDPATLEEGVFA